MSQIKLIKSAALRKAVQRFAEKNKEWASPKHADGECYFASSEFLKYVRRFRSVDIEGMGIYAVGDHPHYERFCGTSKAPAYAEAHYVVKLGRLRIDFTARQFHPRFAFPHVWQDTKEHDDWVRKTSSGLYEYRGRIAA